MKLMKFNTSYVCKLDTVLQSFLIVHVDDKGGVGLDIADLYHDARSAAERANPGQVEMIQCSTLRLRLETGGDASGAQSRSGSRATPSGAKAKPASSGGR